MSASENGIDGMRRTVGDGQVWPPKAVAAEPADDVTVIYDPNNLSAWVESDWAATLEDIR